VALIADTASQEQSASASWVVDGYSTLFRELAEQNPVDFDLLVVPAGVGSLTAAAVRWVAHNNPTAAVIAVEPATAACVAASLRAGRISSVATPGTSMTGLDCATPSANAWPTLRLGLTGAISVSDSEAHQSMRELAARGLTIGDCGAATLAALRALAADDDCAELRDVIRLNRATNVVCVATEGASDPAAYQQIVSNGE
jgi:diaminopropionate ammonia-lyase